MPQLSTPQTDLTPDYSGPGTTPGWVIVGAGGISYSEACSSHLAQNNYTNRHVKCTFNGDGPQATHLNMMMAPVTPPGSGTISIEIWHNTPVDGDIILQNASDDSVICTNGLTPGFGYGLSWVIQTFNLSAPERALIQDYSNIKAIVYQADDIDGTTIYNCGVTYLGITFPDATFYGSSGQFEPDLNIKNWY